MTAEHGPSTTLDHIKRQLIILATGGAAVSFALSPLDRPPTATNSSPNPQGEQVCVVEDPYATTDSNNMGQVIEVSTSEAAHHKVTGHYAPPDDGRCKKKKVRVCALDGPHKGKAVEVYADEVPSKHYGTDLLHCPPNPLAPSWPTPSR